MPMISYLLLKYLLRLNSRGVVMGGISISIPSKSAQVNFLWGKNDIRTVIQQFYTPKNRIYPQNKFLATPLLNRSSW